jgi:carbon monoxide dehydrogenase subunit G
VWKALIDVEHVAPCLPGAAVTGQNDDGTYSGTFTIKIGPTTASYAGKLAMEQVDEAAHSAIMQANGTDKRGQGGAKATIVSTLSETEGGTRVEVNTDYHITGRLARFGRGGMIEDISQRLLREFAERLAESLKAGNVNERAAEGAATEAAEPAVAESVAQQPPTALDAGAVARSVLAERIRRNPIPLALIAGFLLAILLRRRAR